MVILDEETVRDVVRMRGGYHHETAIGKKDKISYDEFLIGLYTSQGFEKKDLRIFWKKNHNRKQRKDIYLQKQQ